MTARHLTTLMLTAAGLSVASAGTAPIYDEPSTSLTSPAPVSLTSDNWVPLLHKGTRELSVDGSLDWQGLEDVEYDFGLSYGYFIRDGWEIGIFGSFSDRNNGKSYSLGGFTEYNFNRDSQWVPFVRLSAAWSRSDYERQIVETGPLGGSRLSTEDVENDAFTLGGAIGLKYFFRENIAISGAIDLEWASSDIYPQDDFDVDDIRARFVLGMNFYF